MIDNTTSFFKKTWKRDEWFGELLSVFALFIMEKISYPMPKEFIPWKTQKDGGKYFLPNHQKISPKNLQGIVQNLYLVSDSPFPSSKRSV